MIIINVPRISQAYGHLSLIYSCCLFSSIFDIVGFDISIHDIAPPSRTSGLSICYWIWLHLNSLVYLDYPHLYCTCILWTNPASIPTNNSKLCWLSSSIFSHHSFSHVQQSRCQHPFVPCRWHISQSRVSKKIIFAIDESLSKQEKELLCQLSNVLALQRGDRNPTESNNSATSELDDDDQCQANDLADLRERSTP